MFSDSVMSEQYDENLLYAQEVRTAGFIDSYPHIPGGDSVVQRLFVPPRRPSEGLQRSSSSAMRFCIDRVQAIHIMLSAINNDVEGKKLYRDDREKDSDISAYGCFGKCLVKLLTFAVGKYVSVQFAPRKIANRTFLLFVLKPKRAIPAFARF